MITKYTIDRLMNLDITSATLVAKYIDGTIDCLSHVNGMTDDEVCRMLEILFEGEE